MKGEKLSATKGQSERTIGQRRDILRRYSLRLGHYEEVITN
jgi:hypothetical protein